MNIIVTGVPPPAAPMAIAIRACGSKKEYYILFQNRYVERKYTINPNLDSNNHLINLFLS